MADKRLRSIYQMALEPKFKSFDEFVKDDELRKARELLLENGHRYGINKGLEGMDTTLTMLGSAAGPARGTKDFTDKLPDVKRQMFEGTGEPVYTGMDDLPNVAGGEGQNYERAALGDNLSAEEYKRMRNDFDDAATRAKINLDKRAEKEAEAKKEKEIEFPEEADLSEFEGTKIDVPANNKRAQIVATGGMPLDREIRMAAAKNAGYDTLTEHRQAGHKAYEDKRYNTYDYPKNDYESQITKSKKSAELINTTETHWAKKALKIFEKLDGKTQKEVQFEIAKGTDDLGILSESNGPISQEAKDDVEKNRGEQHNRIIDRIRKNHSNEQYRQFLSELTNKVAKQFESMPDRTLIQYAKRFFTTENVKHIPKKRLAVVVASMVVQFLGAQEKDKLFADNADFQAQFNSENKLTDKYAPILVNDWLEKFSEKDMDIEDILAYRKLKSIMHGYNNSRGNAIRSSDSTPRSIVTNPEFIRLMQKYNDPILNDLRQ